MNVSGFKWVIGGVLAAASLAGACQKREDDAILVAVAANFLGTAEALEADFEAGAGDTVDLISGSTGQLYAQILNGAPYDVLLAADRHRPQLLESEGQAVASSRFTYATGRLVLWSLDDVSLTSDGEAVLRGAKFTALAIANPDLAPYGAAAMEVLDGLGLAETLSARIVRGQSVGQAYSLVASGNAELGFVALSQVLADDRGDAGSYWEPPGDLYAPIRQDGVLLRHGESKQGARAFLDYLKSDKARSIIEQAGYHVAGE